MMLRIKEAIVVEGRYDKNTLSQLVDTIIVETAGFGVFQNSEKLALFRRLAAERGLIILTDPDGAGFVIRNFLKGSIPPEQVKHAYVPDILGKERRKRTPGKEGKLGWKVCAPRCWNRRCAGRAQPFWMRTSLRCAPADQLPKRIW